MPKIKKRVTITFEPEADVLKLLEAAGKGNRSRVINQALRDKGPGVLRRLHAAAKVFASPEKTPVNTD